MPIKNTPLTPNFPLYIPSKGRVKNHLTPRALDRMKVPYYIVVEEQDFVNYAATVRPESLLVLDPAYQRDYETCDSVGDAKGKGAGPARNFIWDHSIAEGHEWHWVMDDNIRCFYRYNNNLMVPCTSPALFRAMEDFVLRYTNVAMAGPQYEMFCPRKYKQPPFVRNTRIFSCNLIRNSLPYRWRGRYNEDLILSLDLLKAGWCTIQFNAFLQHKTTSQLMPGGNTDELYAKGTMMKSLMAVNEHPDVCRLVQRYNRWHHYCDFSSFKRRRLIRRSDVSVPDEPNEYGIELRMVSKAMR